MLLRYKVEHWTVSETDEDVMTEVEHGVLVPDCCEAARTLLTVVCEYEYDDLTDKDDRFANATPVWQLCGPSTDLYSRVYPGGAYYDLPKIAPRVCPYCATPLPAVRRLSPGRRPKPLYRPVCDGDYCGTCSQRSRVCSCHRPIEAWETCS